jgi:enamine deaminase RidA (YjgF/YER057c/UK114 family)
MKSMTPYADDTRYSGKMPSCEAAVECLSVDCGQVPALVEVSRFSGAGGVMECHISVRMTGADSMDPAECLERAYQRAMDFLGIDSASAVFRRIFCSDVSNQAEITHDIFSRFEGDCATSIIGQAPLPAAKFSLWAYHIVDPVTPLCKELDNQTLGVRRGPLTHYWSCGLVDGHEPGSHSQTRQVIESYDAWLQSCGMTMAGHVVRTWWFVQNIDADYQGLVEARREFFQTHGLTSDTHYIASTGIAGCNRDTGARVILDSHAIAGLRPEQVEYLCAPDHLCPTHDYGVTFERATAIGYADRRHVFLSGTASIDHHGRILHEGDVAAQLDRTMENIEALLAKAGANSGDLAHVIVYLRDPADAAKIAPLLHERLGSVPYVMVHAAVCRPGWLIEIEGIAVITAKDPVLPDF